MLSKSKIKLIRSLETKKFRNESNLFVAEGNKMVADMMPFFDAELIVAKNGWLATQGDVKCNELLVVEDEDIRKASLLKNPQDVIALFRKPDWSLEDVNTKKNLILALDTIQDPGNLGTIIRVADWFGIEDVVCSEDTVDVFSPKTVQATMGALSRVRVHYTDLYNYLSEKLKENTSLYGTFLDGENIYSKSLTESGIIVMGNEGNGISSDIASLINEKLYIPSYPPERETSESLNVAMATGIICAEFRRRQTTQLQ